MQSINSYDRLEEFGRRRLSRNFYMREFLQTEIGAWFGIRNVPDHPEVAIAMGERLCNGLLEPLQDVFGRVHIRSGYRSTGVNAYGNEHKLNCASNEKNFAGHIWDHPDVNGHYGATVCVVVPALMDFIERGGSWTSMAWWIHDHLPYNNLCFFSRQGSFNINWHEQPTREISSYTIPKGRLTGPGMANHAGNHETEYAELLDFVRGNGRTWAASLELPLASTAMVPLDGRPRAEQAGRVRYRAVHEKTGWRKVGNHVSIHNAVYGNDGAAGLFAGKTRISYQTHGEPMYVVVWEEGASSGHLVRASATGKSGIEVVAIPAEECEQFEFDSGTSPSVLAAYFSAQVE